MRRLMFLASAMVFLDVAFFAAIAPLLPDYADDLGLSKAAAGILTASYAAGTLLGSLPGGFSATHFGPRRTVLFGLVLLGVSSASFGFADDIVLLDAARFFQGVGGAFVWTGALTWLILAFPDERRGAVIGTVLGTAVAGTLMGPALGALAAEIGTEPVFASVFVATLALAAAAARLPEPSPEGLESMREVAAALLGRPVLIATAFLAVPSVMFGAVEVLVPLRIDELGGGHALIAVGFIAGGALEAVLAPFSGRYSDRAGRRPPLVAGLAICGGAMVVIAAAAALGVVIAGLVLTALGAGLCFAPGMTILSESAQATGLSQGFAAGLSNMAWAAGQVVGGVAGGALAELAGYALPSLMITALLLATAAFAFRELAPPRPRPAGPEVP